jgi:tetratricopeptide (TPR) repeat protein
MRQCLSVFAVLAAVSLCGCAGTGDAVSAFLRAGPWWQAAQADTLRSQAVELEKRDELTLALDRWRLIQHISFNQAEARREISRLEKKIAAAVQSHYQSGLAALKAKQPTTARNHFLAALRLDPTFRPALQEIKARFTPFPLTVYRVMAGDSLSTVAEKVFGDKGKAILVAWFNDLPEDAPLPPGAMLIVPKPELIASIKAPEKHASNLLAKARARLAANDFDAALNLANRAGSADHAIQHLIRSIHLKQANHQIESGLLAEARNSLAMVPDGFAGKQPVLEKLGAALRRRRISTDLEKAWRHFDRGRYRQSLDLAEITLREDPQNAAAHHLADEARYRIALDDVHHRRYLAARKVLAKANASHKASMTLKARVQKRLLQLAQTHYRNGVKYFINEDLRAAIAEWERALAYDPHLTRARENIDNARRLMQKLKTLP